MNTNNINQIFQKVLKNLTFVGVGLGMFNTVNSLITNQALRDNLEVERIKNSQLIERVDNLMKDNESNSKLENIIRKSFEKNEIKIEALNNKVTQLIETNEENIVIEVNNSMKEINKDLTEVVNQIDETLRSCIIDLDLFNSIITYINNLNFHQTLAFTHICSVILIFIFLIDLIGIVFSDYLIERFNTKVKYPRLYKILEIRRKFKVFYLIKDIIIILIILILLALINILLFITFS